MIEKLKKIWKDPVGSKLIAAALIAIATSLFIYFKSIIQNEEFKIAFINFWNHKISLWIVILIFASIYTIKWFWKKNSVTKINAFEYDERTIELDKALFNKIRNEILPQDTAIGFLRHYNFAGFSFDTDILDGLYKIENENVKSDFEFLNPELEQIKNELIFKISHFTSLIALETFPTPQGRQTVPPEWEIEQPERFNKVVDDIHTTKFEICDKYDELIRKGRRILKI